MPLLTTGPMRAAMPRASPMLGDLVGGAEGSEMDEEQPERPPWPGPVYACRRRLALRRSSGRAVGGADDGSERRRTVPCAVWPPS